MEWNEVPCRAMHYLDLFLFIVFIDTRARLRTSLRVSQVAGLSHSLRETGALPSVSYFAECQMSGTRQT